MNDKLQPMLVIAATIGTLIFNYLASTGILGGVQTNVISDRNPTVLTPAGYAFAIWSLIYLGLIAFSVYQALPAQRERLRAVRRPYIVSCVLNCAWLYFWSQEQLALCAGLIFLLLVTLAYINHLVAKPATTGEYWLVKAPFGLYFGWVTAASLVNAMIALVAGGLPLGYQVYLGAAFIFVAGLLGVLVRVRIANYFFPLAVAWAATAIAVKQSGTTIIVATAAVTVIACLLAAVSFVLSMPSSGSRAAGDA